jgi:hypothetical protein
VSAAVRSPSLLIGEGGDKLAAEVGDVGDHAAPDRVGVLERYPDTPPWGLSVDRYDGPPTLAGVRSGVA